MNKKKWRCRFEECGHEWESVPRRRNSLSAKKRRVAPVMCPKCKRRNWRDGMSERERAALRRQMREQRARARAGK